MQLHPLHRPPDAHVYLIDFHRLAAGYRWRGLDNDNSRPTNTLLALFLIPEDINRRRFKRIKQTLNRVTVTQTNSNIT